MKTIGLTGGIGSGKTTVSMIFEQLGVPVFSCDDIARKIQDTDPRAISGMKQMFGDDIYTADRLDRRRVASIVFNDPKLLEDLNALIHPLVHEAFHAFSSANRHLPLILMESAILIQSGFYRTADFCVHVTAPLETRISRVMSRDNATREQVMARIKNQMPDEKIAEFCKYQIINENLEDVRPQVEKIIMAEKKN